MNLTVTARILGGSGLVILLLTALFFTGLSGLNSIEEGLNSVTDKSTPMLISGSENLSSLLKASAEVSRFEQSRDLKELDGFETTYNRLMAANQSSSQALSQLAQAYPQVLASLKSSDASIRQFSQVAPQLFAAHRQDLQLRDKIVELRTSFEDVADELDSTLFDFADDIGEGEVSDALQSMSSLIREATVSVTDVLMSNNLATLATTIKDISALNQELDEKFSQVQSDIVATSNDYYSDTKSAIDNYKQLAAGSGNILETYQEQLSLAARAKSLLSESESHSDKAQQHLNTVFAQVKDLTQSIKEGASSKVKSSRTMLMGFALIAVLVAIGVNYWVLRSITMPLKEVLRVIVRVANGDLTGKGQCIQP